MKDFKISKALPSYEIAMLGAYKILRGQVDGNYSRFN